MAAPKKPKIGTSKQSKDTRFQYMMAKKPGGQLHGAGS